MNKKFIVLLIVLGLSSGFLIQAQESNLQASVNVIPENYITIISPIDGGIYSSKSVLLNISLADKVKSLDYSVNDGKWSSLCDNCNKYLGTKSFAEGKNTLKLRAQKSKGIYEYSSLVVFYVDSVAPEIASTLPASSKYGNGLFSVQYTELNLKRVVLSYGSNLDASERFIELACLAGTNVGCSTFVNLSDYDGEVVYYRFAVYDNFRIVLSKATGIKVDLTSPILEVSSPINKTYVQSSGKVYFNLTSNEIGKIGYYDNGKWNSLCDNCDGYSKDIKLSFGNHLLKFRATDTAGNFDEELVSLVLRKK